MWLDRTPTIDISRLEWPDRIHLARNRRCISRSRQHISTRTRENSEPKRNRHLRRYTGGACEQLASFSLQPCGRIPERYARNAIVEHLPVSHIRRDLIKLRRRSEEDSTHKPTVVQGHGRAHGWYDRQWWQSRSGSAREIPSGESSGRYEGSVARRPIPPRQNSPQRCRRQDTSRA